MNHRIRSLPFRAGLVGTGLAVLALAFALPAGLFAQTDAPTTVAAPTTTAASTATALSLKPGSTLLLEGGSTLHDWHSKASTIRVKATIGGATIENGDALRAAVKAGQPVKLEVRIPVDGMKSGKDKLDDNMYKALDQKTHPDIVYRLDSYETASAAGDSLKVKTTGRLTVAGKERPLAMTVTVRPDAAGMRVIGSTEFKMTDFDVKPPTMMLGTLRTKDDVKVSFDLVLAPGTSAARSNP